MKFDLGEVHVHKRSRLPHWRTAFGYYFVTFNLFDAIPRWARARPQADEALDESRGACFMRDPRVAKIVASSITHFDGERYALLAWCVMPNHAHVVFSLAREHWIDDVVQTWKGYSAKEANKLMERTGTFWMEDYFDRSIRDSRELHATIEYVLNNPLKAGLRDWAFVKLYAERVPV
ncbi:MAG TPA: transposase [Thermoanaerobaculia bacterium]|nr:transposase [Thermoanaerobaculia bacterium]